MSNPRASPAPVPSPPTRREWRVAVGMFLLTVLSVYWTYGTGWAGGNGWLSPFTDPGIARDSALFAGGMMSIFLAHELGHYLVARRHGMEQSLPLFIPLPLMIGTLGAVIRLRSRPPSRAALLEMGAAGPIAGFVVALFVLAIGLPGTIEEFTPELVMPWPPDEPSAWLAALQPVLEALDSALMAVWPGELPPQDEPNLPLTIMANPPVMDWMGWLLLGAPPGRFAQLTPLGFAGWVGCFLTAVNLVPIGQTDGGHVVNALLPRWSRTITRAVLVLAFIGGITLWPGWIVWSALLWFIGAANPMPVGPETALTRRAKVTAALTLATFISCFMPSPITVDFIPLREVDMRDLDGNPITVDDYLDVLDAGPPDTSSTGREIE